MLLRVAPSAAKGTYANREVPTMKAALRAQLVLLNKNMAEMIRLLQRATDGAFGLDRRPRGMKRASIYFARN
jgi:hypothetical protein